MIPAKVISLPKASERQCWITKNLPFDFSFFWAIDGKKFTLSHPLINSQAVATFLTHVSLINHVKDEPGEMFLILEDDSEFTGTSESIEQRISTLPEDWDMAFLGWYQSDFLEKPQPVNGDWIKVSRFWGMHAYLVRKQSIPKIYRAIHNIDNHIDIQLSSVFSRGGLNGYFIKEPLFKQSSQFPSQINV
jgi:GR25 family glycosyltransferase involved in LPS biosynthesis